MCLLFILACLAGRDLVAAYAALTGSSSVMMRACPTNWCLAAIVDIVDKDRYIVSFCFGILDLVRVFRFVRVFNFIGNLDLCCLTSNVQ